MTRFKLLQIAPVLAYVLVLGCGDPGPNGPVADPSAAEGTVDPDPRLVEIRRCDSVDAVAFVKPTDGDFTVPKNGKVRYAPVAGETSFHVVGLSSTADTNGTMPTVFPFKDVEIVGNSIDTQTKKTNGKVPYLVFVQEVDNPNRILPVWTSCDSARQAGVLSFLAPIPRPKVIGS